MMEPKMVPAVFYRTAAGLYEIRSAITGGRAARVIFCIAERRIVLLHGFIKKTRKTSAADLELATRRRSEVRS